MPRFAIVKNPMQPLKDCEFFDLPGTSINSFIAEKGLVMTNKACIVDSQKVSEDTWNKVYSDNAIVIVTPVVGYNIAILLLLSILIAVAIYFLISIPPASVNGDAESDPLYTLRGQKNQARLGEPIERSYGRTRTWPSYMSRPYNQYYDNDQYLFALLCIGLGEYDVEAIQVEDTLIENFQDITYELVPPGEQVTLFPTNVQTSTEVGGIELYGPNEDDYEEWTGPFVACSAGSKSYTLELDFSCRQGLYKMDSKGNPKSTTVSVEAEYREVDDEGDPVGSWTALTTFSRTDDSQKPQRFTMSLSVPSGRYEVRARRTNDKDENFRIRDTIHWDSLRAFCETEQNFGNVTLLAIKARATDNLNDSSKSGFNVISTSILPVYNSGTGAWTKQITRNPVWAALDVLRAKYGRRLLSKSIDLVAFSELAADLEEEEIWFDGTFSQRGTVWTALQNILAVANAVPVVPAGLISVVRDVPKTIPTLGFNGNNIGLDSVTVSSKLYSYASTDGIEVEYIDEATWKRRTVLCLVGTDKGLNPRQLKLLGCTSRARAYRWGMYQRAVEIYHTDNVVFETGLEGGTAVYGDLIAVKHETLLSESSFEPNQSGRLMANSFGTKVVGPDTFTTILLPVEAEFEFGEVHRISFRNRKGVVRGPYICEADPDENPNLVVLQVELDISDTEVEDSSEQPLYWFGVSGREYTLCKIVKLESTAPHKIRVTAVPYDERVYGFALAEPPALDYFFDVPADPSAPSVGGLTVQAFPGSLTDYVASWTPSLGAAYYIVSKSLDGTNYVFVQRVTVSNCTFPVEAGSLWVKVYAVNVGAGPAATWTGTVGSATTEPDAVTGLEAQEEFTGDVLYLKWDRNDLATSYRLQFFIGATMIYEKTSTGTSTTFSLANATNGAAIAAVSLDREIGVIIRAENAIGNGPYSDEVVFTNPTPTAPLSLSAGSPTGSVYPVVWEHGYDDDLKHCKVYASTTIGFTPGPGNLVATVAAYGNTSSVTAVVTTYWRVSAVDKWGTEESMSPEASIVI
jgi:hypothetical protein